MNDNMSSEDNKHSKDKTSKDKFYLYWYVLAKKKDFFSYSNIFRLNDSRAHRILWTLEILKLDYEVEIHLRDPETFRCDTMFDIHQLGKAPMLKIIFADGSEPLLLLESGLIMQYLLKHYDPENILNPEKEADKLRVDYYLHYSEGTLQHLQISILINSVAKKIAPIGLKYLAKVFGKGLNNGYYIHEWRLNLEYLEKKLKEEGTGYFIGDKLTAADIILSFPVMENVFDNEYQIHKLIYDDRSLTKQYPNLAQWSLMIKNNALYSKITQVMNALVEEKKRSSK